MLIRNTPPKIAFFCPTCVTEAGVVLSKIWCKTCDNTKLITPFTSILELTNDYCKPSFLHTRNYPKGGIYYTLLLTNDETLGNLSDGFTAATELIATSRFIKDRFFFTIPLTDEFVEQSFFFITQITWIPK